MNIFLPISFFLVGFLAGICITVAWATSRQEG